MTAPKTIHIPLTDIDALNKYSVVAGIDNPTVGDPCATYVLDEWFPIEDAKVEKASTWIVSVGNGDDQFTITATFFSGMWMSRGEQVKPTHIRPLPAAPTETMKED